MKECYRVVDERIKEGLYSLSTATNATDVVVTWLMMGESTKDK